MKTRRSEAEENAASQVDDYWSNLADSYASSSAPPSRPGHPEGPTPAGREAPDATSGHARKRDDPAQAVERSFSGVPA